jgi:ATP phosphoribosyltransferase
MEMITIALAKGRLAEEAFTLLEGMGIDCSAPRNPGRKLVLENVEQAIRFILVKPADVPTYVEHGVADMGVVGKDTLMEENRPLFELLDLGFGKCRLCIAGYPGRPAGYANERVATKYPNIARNYYAAQGRNIQIIKLNGSVELGPIVGLSDVILDIVESGSTLKANGLAVLEEICVVSARLVVNRVALKTKRTRIQAIVEGFQSQLPEMKQE